MDVVGDILTYLCYVDIEVTFDVGEELIPWKRFAPRAESGEGAGELLAEFPLRFMASASRVLQPAWQGARSLLRS